MPCSKAIADLSTATEELRSMKKIFPLLIASCLLLSAAPVMAQSLSSFDMANKAVEEMQASDPQAAQKFSSALKQGDLAGAKKIYEDFKATQKPAAAEIQKQVPAAPQALSLFERTLSGSFPSDIMSQGLHQFGYELFLKTTSSMAPSMSLPVGPDYIIGPGDQFTLTLWGTTEGIYTVMVSKEGEVTLPKVGVVSVAGLRFGELEKTLKRHLSNYYSNFNLSVAMGNLKTLSVYVVGEVANPGNYTVSSLTTVYGALFAAGGPTKKGTLRSIQVLRSGKIFKTIDLYDFLMKGDRSQDIKLQNEDTVFVPLIGKIAGVAGMVYRPAIYELKGQETLSDVIKMAGGILPIALGGRLQLNRYVDNQKKVFLDIKLDDQQIVSPRSSDSFREPVQNMDAISIRPVYDKVWETVELDGAVEHPGSFQWGPGIRLREIIIQGQLLPKTDMKRAEVARIAKDKIERTIIPIDLAALMAGDESQNIPLEPKDKIQIYSVDQNPANAWETVNLAGVVRNQGNFQWKPGLRLREIIIQGQLLPQSDMTRADVIRLNKNLLDRTIIPVDLTALMAGDESQNIVLEPQDHIRVYSRFKAAQKVTVSGQVIRPGEYEINEEVRLSDLLRRVGGFTAGAYPYGAVFKRSDVKNAQAKNLQTFILKMQSQIFQSAAAGTATAVSGEEAAFAKGELALNQSLLQNIKAMQEQSEGRVAINITENIDEWAGTREDLLLKDGDSITIPKRPQEVTIMGEVHSPGAFVSLPGMTAKQYIDQTGGYTNYAEQDQVFVLQANGIAISGDSPSVGNIENMELRAGDTIFVPQKVERYATMRFTKDIVDILFKTAVVIATITILF